MKGAPPPQAYIAAMMGTTLLVDENGKILVTIDGENALFVTKQTNWGIAQGPASELPSEMIHVIDGIVLTDPEQAFGTVTYGGVTYEVRDTLTPMPPTYQP